MGVVACGSEEAAIGSELEHAAVVATLATLRAPLDHFFFLGEGVAFQSEATDALSDKVGGRVEKKEVIVFLKVGIEGNSEEAVFLITEDFDFGKSCPVTRDGMNAADLSLKFDEIDGAIGSEIHAHGAGEIFGNDFGFEAEGVDRGGEGSQGEEEEVAEH